MISRIYVTEKGKVNFLYSYLLSHNFSREEILKIASALTNPILEEFSIDKFPDVGHPTSFTYAIEIGFKPGVTDNIAHTVKETIGDLLHLKENSFAVYTSKIYLIYKKIDRTGAEKIAFSLHNPLIERANIFNANEIEIEALAQTWSEHCKHTIFANPIDDIKDGLYKTYIKGATNEIRKKKGLGDFCISVFSDNAGGIIFDNKYMVTHKVETHNSPSALDPYGGAITGIVGVNRDTIGFGMGAKPIANLYGFCFGYPDDTRALFKDSKLTQKMLLPARIAEGVIKGINVGGNCSGIPTLSGFVKYDDRYRGKPLVFAGTVGLILREMNGKFSHEKSACIGNYIVVVGGKVGLDGVHGAT